MAGDDVSVATPTMTPEQVAAWEAAMRAGAAPPDARPRPATTHPWRRWEERKAPGVPRKPRDPLSPAPSANPPPTDITSKTLVADAIAWTHARAAEIVAWRTGQ